jgi:F420H(2)-dependent quinone reductase
VGRTALTVAHNHRSKERSAPHEPDDVPARGRPPLRLRLQGRRTHPDWYHNLLAHPNVTVELGDQTYQAIAKPVTGDEHDQIYARWAEQYPQLRDYQEKTTRIIPVIELELHDEQAS